MKQTTYILLLLLTLITGCKGGGDQEFDIRGVWALNSIHIKDVSDYIYAERSSYIPVKVYEDSVFYVGHMSAGNKRMVFIPSYSGRYKIIAKGGGEYVYVEDGELHKITVACDSVINVCDLLRTNEWHRMDGTANANVDDILSVVAHGRDSWDEEGSSYVFTAREHSLETDRQNLSVVILCIVLALVLTSYFTRNVLREKSRIEQQLRQIKLEIEERPKVVQEALMSVEDEFLKSDFYLSIRRRIASGDRLRKADWDEIERQVNTTYSGFTGRLLSLYPMSQVEMQTCLLLKLRVSNTDIANTLNKSTSAISSMRSRLYAKVFHDKGGAKEWDEFVLSL